MIRYAAWRKAEKLYLNDANVAIPNQLGYSVVERRNEPTFNHLISKMVMRAKHEIIVFIDDGCLIDKPFINRVLKLRSYDVLYCDKICHLENQDNLDIEDLNKHMLSSLPHKSAFYEHRHGIIPDFTATESTLAMTKDTFYRMQPLLDGISGDTGIRRWDWLLAAKGIMAKFIPFKNVLLNVRPQTTIEPDDKHLNVKTIFNHYGLPPLSIWIEPVVDKVD